MSVKNINLNIEDIKSQIKGSVLSQESEGYKEAKEIFYGGIDKDPVLIIQVNDETDIAKAIEISKNNNLELSIKSGGHSLLGHSLVDKGIVIDLRNLKKIDINKDNDTVWAGTGLTARELSLELDKYGYVLGFGDTGSVGIGGITLGGGIGFLVRKYGMTIDNLLAAKLVTASGEILYVDAKENSELFWAIKGGGGNFGVVTEFNFKLHKAPEGIGGILVLPATPEVIENFIKMAEKAPYELSTILNIMPAPPMPFLSPEYYGKLIAMAMIYYSGNTEEGKTIIQSFKNLAPPIADLVKPIRYIEMFPQEPGGYHPTAVSKTMFVNQINTDLAKQIVSELNNAEAPFRVIQLRNLGGKMAEVGSSDTAFAHRSSKIMANIAAFYDTPENKILRQSWVDKIYNLLNQGDTGLYSNFVGSEGESVLNQIYPTETLARLKKVKQKYDPDNLFRHNQNIKP